MLFGDDQHVPGVDRVDIKESERVRIFVNNLGGQFFRGYFAEKAISGTHAVQYTIEHHARPRIKIAHKTGYH